MKVRGAVLAVVMGISATASATDGTCVDTPANPLAPVAALVTKPINPVCVADTMSKTYPSGQDGRTWYFAKKVEVRCKYTCTSDNFPTITVEGSRIATFFGEGDTALSCYGVPYEERYNNAVGWFVKVPMEPKRFAAGKSDVIELKNWAEGKPWGTR